MAAAVILLIVLAEKAPEPPNPTYFRYERSVQMDGPLHENACVLLDAEVFAHADATLADLRLYTSQSQEIPYAITLSRTASTADTARLLHQTLQSPRHLALDLAMPERPYSSVELTFAARDFLATAQVTGLRALNDSSPVFLGNFSLFDFTTQRLGRSLTLPITESTFPFLHLDLRLTPAEGNKSLVVTPQFVAGANVPPSRIAQTLFTPVAETSALVQRPHESAAVFSVPAHVPVERVTVVLDPADRTNFNRTLTVSATLTNAARRSHAIFPVEQITGEISRVHLTQSGQQIDGQSLSVSAVLGSNAQSDATVEVAIENGGDRPLKLRAVSLEMRQRKLCFAVPGGPVSLYYGASSTGTAGIGASTVPSPDYNFPRLFNAAAPVRSATLAPERLNPGYIPHIFVKPFLERYPRVLWIALLSSVLILSIVAIRSARTVAS